MARKTNSKVQQMQKYLTYALITATVLFILYLIAAGIGIIWLKVVAAVLGILISFACLAFLYLTNSLLRPRNLWMTTAAGAIIVCLLFSLMLSFPSPNKYKQAVAEDAPSASYVLTDTIF